MLKQALKWTFRIGGGLLVVLVIVVMFYWIKGKFNSPSPDLRGEIAKLEAKIKELTSEKNGGTSDTPAQKAEQPESPASNLPLPPPKPQSSQPVPPRAMAQSGGAYGQAPMPSQQPPQPPESFGLVPATPPTSASPPIQVTIPGIGSSTVSQTAGAPQQPRFASKQDKAASRQKEQELVAQMFNMQAPSEERVSAVEALGHYPYGRVAKALCAVLSRDDDPAVRIAAAKSLGSVANMSFMPFLQRVAETDPDPSVKQETVGSMQKILARAAPQQGSGQAG